MSKIAKENTDLELCPLQAHEFDLVSGGGIPVQLPFTNAASGLKGEYSTYVLWGMLEPATSPVSVNFWVGRLGGIY